MRHANLNCTNGPRAGLPGAAAALLLAALLPAQAMAQAKGQRTFASAAEAGDALVIAAQGGDEKALADILGPDGRDLVASGDATEDARSRAEFVQRYQEMHRLVREPDGTTTLYIGARNWPTPIPIVNRDQAWYFDTDAGRREILFRRIGQNETATIRVCLELAEAQKEYRALRGGSYARSIASDAGQHDGLYWKAGDGETRSPIGPLVAAAEVKDRKAGPLTPYQGYCFRALAGQGRQAPGGAHSYAANGTMTRGFAFVAYPAKYRSSGVMTFIVDRDGIVYQRDLGKGTEAFARTVKAYNPDAGWKAAEGQLGETAREQAPE